MAITRDLDRVVSCLSSPRAYPWPVESVQVEHTHASVVFLAGARAVKVKRPVNLGFLDYASLEARQRFCAEEVRLNRRLAPDVYLGVGALAAHGDRFRVVERPPRAGEEPVVIMRRLPDTATLRSGIAAGTVTPDAITRIAVRLAEFHGAARRDAHVARFGSFATVAGNARENFDQTRDHVGRSVSETVWTRCRAATEAALAHHEGLIRARATAGVPCETHGDLRLDHVYLFDAAPPKDIEVIDCIEFNERFRFADPVADVAFLSMELRCAGRSDLADRLERAWAGAAGDPDAATLFPFYVAYRSVVRAKVRGILALSADVPAEVRRDALDRARAHWLLALGALEAPRRRPALILVSGLPGTGKTTVARILGERADFQVIRTDVVRKQLAGVPTLASAKAEFGAGIYDPTTTRRTYAECLARAERALADGGRVVLDATLRDARRRAAFTALAQRLAVPVVTVVCETSRDVALRRLADRRGDASDADAEVYERAAREWTEPKGPNVVHLDTTPEPCAVTVATLEALSRRGLY